MHRYGARAAMQRQLAGDLTLHRRALFGKFEIGTHHAERGIGELVHLERLAQVAITQADPGIDRRERHLEEERGGLVLERDVLALALDAQAGWTAGEDGYVALPRQSLCSLRQRRTHPRRSE